MLKKRIKKLITDSGLLLKILNGLASDVPRVFVWHRFAPPHVKMNARVNANDFGWQLDQIQKGFQVLTLGETLHYYHEHRQWPQSSVVLTVDDGYRDFYLWAYPELKKRNMQATFFATVNFIEGNIWLWPDRLQWALDNSSVKELTLHFQGVQRHFTLNDLHEKEVAWKTCSDHCISLADIDKEKFIAAVEQALQVSCPEKPTEDFCAVTWEELLEMRRNGIEIGSHTMNHPILSRIDLPSLVEEIVASKIILAKKMENEITSFCYPNSSPGDITETVIETVQKAGYLGAVFGVDLKTWNPYTIPRMGVSSSRTDFLWKLYGGETF